MKYSLIVKYYDESAYNCPYCGYPSSECEENGSWGYICKFCGKEFETLDT